MIEYRTLEDVAFQDLHQCFVEAFSDYEVRLELSMSKLQETLQRRSYDPKASICALDHGRIVGFLLNGIRSDNAVLSAYDTGTAVLPVYRKQGITRAMFQATLQQLHTLQVEQYVLEVLQSNTPAIQLYEKQGFHVSRSLECYRLEPKDVATGSVQVEAVESFTQAQWRQLQGFWDYPPSWQNAIESIQSVPCAFAYSVVKVEGEIVGYGIMEWASGDLPQLAVAKAHRRQGVGSALLADLVRRTQAKHISIVNVDARDEALKGFLQKKGASIVTTQYEMVRMLEPDATTLATAK